jgi:hypothetical protein
LSGIQNIRDLDENFVPQPKLAPAPKCEIPKSHKISLKFVAPFLVPIRFAFLLKQGDRMISCPCDYIVPADRTDKNELEFVNISDADNLDLEVRAA